jgi:histone-lysine N-methyltransferase SETMAR
VAKYFRWVPHTLTPTEKTERAIFLIELLHQLRSIKHSGWQFITTHHESRVHISTDHAQIWLRVEEAPLERPRYIIQDPKMMVTIAWNPLGFHLLDALPKGNTCNAEYYRVNILAELLPLRLQVDGRRLVIHADKAKLHTARKWRAFCEENRLCLAVHPPYSPDLAPSDFFLFGQIKHCLQGIAFRSRKGLLTVIHEILGAISRSTLEDVFRHWRERLEWISQNNCDDYLQAKYWLIYFSRIPLRE